MKYVLLGVLFLSLASCSSVEKKSDTTTPRPESTVASEFDDLTRIGKKFEESLNGSKTLIVERFQSRVFVQRVKPDASEKLLDGLVTGFSKKGGIRTILGEGSFRFLRVLEFGGQQYLLYRQLGVDDLKYLGLEVAEKNGKVFFPDIYLLHGAVLTSTSTRSALGGAKSIQEINDAAERLQRLASDPEKAIQNWRAFPEEAKKKREFQFLYLNVLSTSSLHLEYERAVLEYFKNYPHHPTSLFLGLDFHQATKDYPELYKTIDGIELLTGREPYLDVYRAIGLEGEGKLEEAQAMIERCLKEEPELEICWEFAFDYTIRLKQFDKSARVFNELSDRFGYDWDLPYLETEFESFYKSKEGAEAITAWSERQN